MIPSLALWPFMAFRWVGTRFVAAKEAGAPPRHQKGVVDADYADTIRTIIFTGRPMRVLKNDYIVDWEENKSQEIKELTNKGILPAMADKERLDKSGEDVDFKTQMDMIPLLMGQAAGAIDSVLPAQEIIDEMMSSACSILQGLQQQIIVEAEVARL